RFLGLSPSSKRDSTSTPSVCPLFQGRSIGFSIVSLSKTNSSGAKNPHKNIKPIGRRMLPKRQINAKNFFIAA
ncbi:MAG: hypothetical protein ACUVT6_13295, partial [Thermodesulfobacteriota bacterium]